LFHSHHPDHYSLHCQAHLASPIFQGLSAQRILHTHKAQLDAQLALELVRDLS
jgi:hypothetical protein